MEQQEINDAFTNLWRSIDVLRGKIERLTLAVAVMSTLLLGDGAFRLMGL